MPSLSVYKQGKRMVDVRVQTRGALLGRDRHADVVLADPLVSRRHATLYPSGGCWILRDLSARNGTFVNGTREFRRALVDGDEVEIGPYLLRFHRVGGEGVPDGFTDPGLPPFTGDRRESSRAHGEPTSVLEAKDLERVRAEAAAQMGPHLVEEGAKPIIHALRSRLVSMGAGPDVNIRVPGAGRDEAATIERMAEGEFWVRRIGWLSRVLVNGERVRVTPLHKGDLLEVGPSKFRFQTGAD